MINMENSGTVEKLIGEIEQAVKQKNFTQAQKLRDTLIETEPMAINLAIKVAELIDQAMSADIDRDHLALWPELYDVFSPEERNCFYHSLKKYGLAAGKILLKFGSLNNRLFFIESGTVAVGLPQPHNKLKVIAQLGRGDVLGEYSFATIALCSATAVTKTETRLRCLEGRTAEGWDEKFPGLYDKLIAYCLKHGRVEQIEKFKQSQARSHPRHPVHGIVNAVLLDRSGQPAEPRFRGEIEEISRSGTSFTIHSNQKDELKKLLTRSLSLEFVCRVAGKQLSFTVQGEVVRVSFLLHNDYQLHIKFHRLIPEEIISRFIP
jgi:CRP-like cAMP-binding protein